jgi:hypothetical protein
MQHKFINMLSQYRLALIPVLKINLFDNILFGFYIIHYNFQIAHHYITIEKHHFFVWNHYIIVLVSQLANIDKNINKLLQSIVVDLLISEKCFDTNSF